MRDVTTRQTQSFKDLRTSTVNRGTNSKASSTDGVTTIKTGQAATTTATSQGGGKQGPPPTAAESIYVHALNQIVLLHRRKNVTNG